MRKFIEAWDTDNAILREKGKHTTAAIMEVSRDEYRLQNIPSYSARKTYI